MEDGDFAEGGLNSSLNSKVTVSPDGLGHRRALGVVLLLHGGSLATASCGSFQNVDQMSRRKAPAPHQKPPAARRSNYCDRGRDDITAAAKIQSSVKLQASGGRLRLGSVLQGSICRNSLILHSTESSDFEMPNALGAAMIFK